MGLASAIGHEVHLIYPDTKHTMLNLLKGVYLPRESKEKTRQSVLIMWSNLSGWPDHTELITLYLSYLFKHPAATVMIVIWYQNGKSLRKKEK